MIGQVRLRLLTKGRLYQVSKTIIVIPARGGSKGIEKKNLRKVGDLSLLARAALFGKYVSNFLVVVSSDSQEILDEAHKYEVLAISRPRKLSTDQSSSESTVKHAIDILEYNYGYSFNGSELIALVQCTSPFQDVEAFNQATSAVSSSKYDSAFSAVEDFAFQWIKSEDKIWRPLNHQKEFRKMRQDLPKTFKETGGFYVTRMRDFQEVNSRFSKLVLPVPVSIECSLDIDTIEQLNYANKLSKVIDPNLEYLV